MEQFRDQSNSPEGLGPSSFEFDPEKRKSKEKNKDDKQSRFERIQEALRRALESLLTSDDSQQKPESSKKPVVHSDKERKDRGASERAGEAPEVAPSPHVEASYSAERLSPTATTDTKPGSSRAADSAWQRARQRVREFIQSKLTVDSDGSEMAPSVEDSNRVNFESSRPELSEEARQQMTIDELELYFDKGSDEAPSRDAAELNRGTPNREVVEQPVRYPYSDADIARQQREQRRQARRLRTQKRQLKRQERQVERNTRHRKQEHPHAPQQAPRPIYEPRESSVHRAEQPLYIAPPTTVRAASVEVRNDERRVDYPPPPKQQIDSQERNQSRPMPRVEKNYQTIQTENQPREQLRPPQEAVAQQQVIERSPTPVPTHSEAPPAAPVESKKPTFFEKRPQSLAEIIEQREAAVTEAALASERQESSSRSAVRSNVSRAQQRGGDASSLGRFKQPQRISDQGVSTQATPVSNQRQAAKDSSSARIGFWQQVLLVLINIALIGLLVRELVL